MEVVRTRLCEWAPVGIDALAFAPPDAAGVTSDSSAPRLAVGRANGAIELWDTNTWHLRCSSPGKARRSIRSIVWVIEPSTSKKAPPIRRLITAGLHREVTEWDPETLEPLESVSSGGGAVWSLCVLGNRVYAACDDGSVRVVSLEGGVGSLMYERRINVAKERIMSLAAHGASLKDQFLYAGGSTSRITKWSVATGTCEGSMKVEQVKDNETLIWSLACLNDQTLASGDSLGLVQIWDTVTCVMLHRFAQHQADVLTLAVSGDGQTLYSGGIDAKIACFSQQTGSQERWVFVNAQFCHSHDIRAISVEGSQSGSRRPYVSGGVAGSLFVHCPSSGNSAALKAGERRKSCPTARPLQCSSFSPFFQTAAVAQASRLLLCQKDHNLELWYLQEPKKAVQLDVLDVEKNLPEAQLLLRMTLAGPEGSSNNADGSRGSGDHLCASAISPDGKIIAASDMAGTRVFRLTLGDLDVQREKGLPKEVSGAAARALHFCSSGLLAVATWTGHRILLVDCTKFTVAARFEEDHKAPVCLLASGGPGGEWLASADLAGAVHIYSMDGLQHHAQVPIGAAGGVPTALGFDGPGKLLAVATSSHSVVLFDVEAQTLAAGFPPTVRIPAHLLSPHARVCGIAAPSKSSGKLLLWGHSFMLALNLTPSSGAAADKQAVKGEGDVVIDGPCAWKAYGGMQHILALTALDEAKWGSPLTSEAARNEVALKTPPKKKRKSGAGDAAPATPAAAAGGAAAMVLSFEVSKEAAEKSLPPAFERKKYTK
mmetsp:Transcript_3625/g.6884  ORF Transcript_3625/g.6884 Transcript_3625/m.6884 type:complete len:770 (-) Transcript_3625:142-2451(-)